MVTLGLNLNCFLVGIITALDRANAEDAILPLPQLHTQEKKRKHNATESSGDIQSAPHTDLSSTKLIEKRGKSSVCSIFSSHNAFVLMAG